MINNIREMNAAKDKAWGRTRDAVIDDLGNNSFPGQVSYPSVTRGTLDEDGVGKPLTKDSEPKDTEEKEG